MALWPGATPAAHPLRPGTRACVDATFRPPPAWPGDRRRRLLGVPLAIAYGASRILPDALWFDELGQIAVLRRVLAAQAQFSFVVVVTVALFIGANLAAALRRTAPDLRRVEALGIVGVSLVTGTLFASATKGDWQTFLLWRHRQTLRRRRSRSTARTSATSSSRCRSSSWRRGSCSGWSQSRPASWCWCTARGGRSDGAPFTPRSGPSCTWRFSPPSSWLVLAWRFRLEQYALELGQPSPRDGQLLLRCRIRRRPRPAAGARCLTFLAVVLALACLAAPLVARAGSARAAKWFVAVPVTLLLVAVALVGALIPALVQRFVVDPNPLLSEQPFLERSIAATRTGLGLDAIDVEAYSPTGSISAADYPLLSEAAQERPDLG